MKNAPRRGVSRGMYSFSIVAVCRGATRCNQEERDAEAVRGEEHLGLGEWD